jgi:hypothetical protein
LPYAQLEYLSREELASRLTLNTLPTAVGRAPLFDAAVTIMDVCSSSFLYFFLAGRGAFFACIILLILTKKNMFVLSA